MKTYTISFGVTFTVKAEDEAQAIDRAEDLCCEEWGKTFYREAWMSDPEEVES